jgi:ribosome-associated translation inhibitor RaiA
LILPIQITWRDIPQSDAVESVIREKADKLDKFFDKITSCRVLVESSHKRHHHGNLYRIRIELEVPGDQICVTRDAGDEHAHEDIYVTLRDSFNAARRQLQDYARVRRGHVKQHNGRRSTVDLESDEQASEEATSTDHQSDSA